MGQMSLRCGGCGYAFQASDAEVAKAGGARCPSCGQQVLLHGPNFAAPRKKVRVLQTGEEGGDNKKLWLILAAAGGGLVILLVVVMMALSGGGTDPEEDGVSTGTGSSPSERKKQAYRPQGPGPAPVPPLPKLPQLQPQALPPPVPPVPAPSQTASTPSPATPLPTLTVGPIPPDRLETVRSQILSLPIYYLDLALGAEDRKRIERIVAAGQGSPDDGVFLDAVLKSDKLGAVRAEAASIEEKYVKLSAEALEGLPVDKVVMNDGRTLHCKILEETAEAVRVERKLASGVGGMMNLKRPEIKEVAKGKGIGVEFKAKWDQAQKGAPADRTALLAWCKENTLTQQAQLVACVLLKADAGVPAARAELGLPPDPVKRAAELAAGGGGIKYEGKEYTPKELKEKLLKDGYVILDGLWHLKKDRMISVPGLFRYDKQEDKPVTITPVGAEVCHDAEVNYKVVQDITTNTFVEKPEVKLNRRFLSNPLRSEMFQGSVPTDAGYTAPVVSGSARPDIDVVSHYDRVEPKPGKSLSGEVMIAVPLGQPIIEAWVTTHAQVKAGGSIVVHLMDGASRVKVYQCGAKEDSPHKLPDAIRGKQEVNLVAVISGAAAYTQKTDRRLVRGVKRDGNRIIQRGLEVVHHRMIPDFQAQLFPSNSNTIEVFRLRAVVGEPAAGLNSLFEKAGAMEMLKQ